MEACSTRRLHLLNERQACHVHAQPGHLALLVGPPVCDSNNMLPDRTDTEVALCRSSETGSSIFFKIILATNDQACTTLWHQCFSQVDQTFVNVL